MIKIAVLLLSLAMPAQLAHKFYVSHYLVNYKARKQSLQISGKIFTDDLEKALIHFHHNTDIRLPARDTLQVTDSLVESYFRYHFQLKKNDKMQVWNWVGFEYQNDVTWVYIEQTELPLVDLREMTLHCTALIKQFDDQKNIMDLRLGRQKRTEILTNRSTSVKLTD